jgi:hypothetical protein
VEVPESVRIGLANISPSLHARWNPRAVLKRGWSFDVNGQPRGREYEGRWTLWARDVFGVEYKVTTLVAPDGGFIPLGDWVVEMMNFMNPERFGGDMSKMIEELVDKPNEDVSRVGERQFRELVDYLADLCWSEVSQGSRITVPQPLV